MRVKELPGWPPSNFSGWLRTGGKPIRAEDATIGDVLLTANRYVMFACLFDGETVNDTFYLPNFNISLKIAQTLRENRGQTLLSIGDVEIPAD
jgi:hypothetical protein